MAETLCRNVKVQLEEESSAAALATAVNDFLVGLTEEVLWDIDFGRNNSGNTFYAVITYIEA